MKKENFKKSTSSRRDFLTKSLLAGIGLTTHPFLKAASDKRGDDFGSTESFKQGAIPRRKLGALEVSSIGLGCLPMVGFYGGPKSRKEMIKVIRTAFEQGVIFFDTAESYGPFLDEEILGEAVEPFRKKVVVSTKFGFNLNPEVRQSTREKNSRPEHIKVAVEHSLRRLRTDYIDLYYQHRVDPAVPIEDVAGAIKDLVNAGKVKHWGLSEPGLNTIRRAHAVHPLSAIQNEYSIWSREVETTVLPVCEELGIGFVPWCPLGSGFLAGAVTSDTILSSGDVRNNLPRMNNAINLKQNLNLLEYLNVWAKRKNAKPAQISLAWLLHQKPFVVPIPGTTQLTHLKEDINANSIKFSAAEMKQFNDGLSNIKITGARNSEGIMRDMGVEAPPKV